jgi:uncharacterized protein (DUF58 family)
MINEQQESREPTIFNSLLMLFFVCIFLFIALIYRQNSLSLLAILVLVVAGGAKAWSSRSMDRIRCFSAVETRRVFPGESVTLATTVENGKWLPVWLKILWTFDNALEPSGEDGITSPHEAAVLWHQTVQFDQTFVALCRGVYQVGPPRIRTGDFLGFFEKEKSAGDINQLIVYPRLVSVKQFAIRRRDLFGVPGAGSPVKDPIYILGTRDYQPVNPARHIHWKASARHLRLQEKIFEPSEQARILLTLDVKSFEQSNQPECFEHSLEVLASLAVRFDRMGYAVCFAANGILKGGHSAVVPPIRGHRQIPAILETLARIQAQPDGPIETVISQFPGSLRGITCLHFCYDSGPAALDMAQYFRRRQITADFLVSRRDPISAPFSNNYGMNRHFIDDIRINRSRQT